MGLITKLAWFALPTLTVCAVLSQVPSQGAGANAEGRAISSINPRIGAGNIIKARSGYPLAEGWKWGQARTVDFGEITRQEVADALDSAFDAVKGSKLVPHVPWKKQHVAYTAKVDEVFRNLPFRGNDQLKLAMRVYANHAVFGATYKFASIHPSVYYGKQGSAPKVGRDAVSSPVVQRIIDNGLKGDCVDGAVVFVALCKLSGVDGGEAGVIARKYGQTEDVFSPTAVSHSIVNLSFRGRDGKMVAVLSNPTWAAEPNTDWSRLQLMPNAQYLMIGTALDDGATDALFFWQHIFHHSPDASPVRFSGGYPTFRQAAVRRSDPKIDPIAKEYEQLNMAILSGR